SRRSRTILLTSSAASVTRWRASSSSPSSSPAIARPPPVPEGAQLRLDVPEPLFELRFAFLQLRFRRSRQRRVAAPPVDAELLRLVGGGDEKPKLDREQLDVEQVDRDVAGHHDPLVQHALQHVG